MTQQLDLDGAPHPMRTRRPRPLHLQHPDDDPWIRGRGARMLAEELRTAAATLARMEAR